MCEIGLFHYIQEVNGQLCTIQEEAPTDDVDCTKEQIVYGCANIQPFKDIDMCSMGKRHVHRIPLVDGKCCSMFVDQCIYPFVDFELVISYDEKSKAQADRFLRIVDGILLFSDELHDCEEFLNRSTKCDIKAKRFMTNKRRLVNM